MSDFFQNGIITTLHNLGDRPLHELEADLVAFSHDRPIALVLPCLYSELAQPALANIVAELSKASYISDIIIGLDRANQTEYQHALEYFSVLPQRHHVLWNDGPRLQAIHNRLNLEGLAPTELGKGCNVWY